MWRDLWFDVQAIYQICKFCGEKRLKYVASKRTPNFNAKICLKQKLSYLHLYSTNYPQNFRKITICRFLKFLLKSVHFRNPVTRSSFLSKALSFSLTFAHFENDNAFERNEYCATLFLKSKVQSFYGSARMKN